MHAVIGLLVVAQNCHLGLSGFEFGVRVEETWEAENSSYNLGLWRGRGEVPAGRRKERCGHGVCALGDSQEVAA